MKHSKRTHVAVMVTRSYVALSAYGGDCDGVASMLLLWLRVISYTLLVLKTQGGKKKSGQSRYMR